MGIKKVTPLWIILLVIIISSLIVQSAENIIITGLVNDYANILTPDYRSKIEGTLTQLYDSKTAEFSIVTIESLEGKDIDSYALDLAQGTLGDKEKNNGLLLLVALKERKYKFEVGRGIEPILNDAKIGRIGRTYLVENFRDGNYGKGIYEASLAVKTTLMGDEDSAYYVKTTPNVPIRNTVSLVFFLIMWIFIIVLSVSRRAGRVNGIRRKKGDYFDAALLAAFIFGGRGRGGFGGRGLGGGGFGGFGGGGFGGGGAGGSW